MFCHLPVAVNIISVTWVIGFIRFQIESSSSASSGYPDILPNVPAHQKLTPDQAPQLNNGTWKWQVTNCLTKPPCQGCQVEPDSEAIFRST